MLDRRVVLITGGSGGIGAAMVRALTGAGARVAAGYRSGADRATSTGAALTVQADLADPGACERLGRRSCSRSARSRGCASVVSVACCS